MTIYLMRHGQPTYASCEAHGYTGFGAELGPLTPLGVTQAEAAARDARLHTVDCILSSPYPRALQTAAIVSRVTGAPIQVEVALHEWRPTLDDTPCTHAEISASWHEFLARKGVHQPDDQYPLWESAAQMRARILPAMLPYLDLPCKTLLIVSHGGVMRVLDDDFSLPRIAHCEILTTSDTALRAVIAKHCPLSASFEK